MTRPVVLVVDDESVIRELLKRHFSNQNFDVYTANSAEQAIGVVSTLRPDLVLMDIRMPGEGGIKGLIGIRKRYHDLLVIMLTAVEDVRVAQLAMTNGARAYVTKPVDLPVLTKILHNHNFPKMPVSAV